MWSWTPVKTNVLVKFQGCLIHVGYENLRLSTKNSLYLKKQKTDIAEVVYAPSNDNIADDLE